VRTRGPKPSFVLSPVRALRASLREDHHYLDILVLVLHSWESGSDGPGDGRLGYESDCGSRSDGFGVGFVSVLPVASGIAILTSRAKFTVSTSSIVLIRDGEAPVKYDISVSCGQGWQRLQNSPSSVSTSG